MGEPRDIGLLVKEVQNDVFEEHEEEIKDALFDYYGRQIKKGIVSGLAPWYLDRIAVDPFEEESS